jgi:hypothetical protein
VAYGVHRLDAVQPWRHSRAFLAPAAMPTTCALQDLSDRLARDYDASTWKAAFRAGTMPSLDERELTVLCTDLPATGWTVQDMDALASRFGGRGEPCAQGKALLVFDDQADAIRAALSVQRLAAGQGVRSCLACGPVHEARFMVNGHEMRVLAGTLVDAALQGLFCNAGGTIALEPCSYASLEQSLAQHARDAVLTTEWDDCVVTAAMLTPAPCADAGSTFAGLGRF